MEVSEKLALITKGNRAYAARDRAIRSMRWLSLLLLLFAVLVMVARTNGSHLALLLAVTGLGCVAMAMVVAAILVHSKKWAGDDATEAARLDEKPVVRACSRSRPTA